ncbi:MAG: DUF3579 domain-containing protein [Nitrosomonadaceae bacterium]|nr:DUF3579 domain-containing protein [Nitrosomonadaceae bacterium]
MAKTAATLKWDAWAAPLYLLARLYLIVRSDLEQWRVAKQLPVNRLLIKGICRNGKTFRPSDWAERLCGAAVVFLPDTALPSGAQSTTRPYHGYSSYVRPAFIDGARCVIIDARLRDLEPRAWDYVTGFAHDNDLVMLDLADLVAAPALSEITLAAA